MRLLRLVAAVVVLGSGAGTLVADPQWDAAAALEQTLAADEWIRRAGSVGVAAPAAWSITERAGLAAPMTKFAEGNPGGSFHLVLKVRVRDPRLTHRRRGRARRRRQSVQDGLEGSSAVRRNPALGGALVRVR